MVKTGSRSKWAKGKGADGTSTAVSSSPTRRLKKGGKRGRRLCHKDGCTLCPSFGFEGDVAVSCSHHKEEGMRNLTARRCQHEGCFTVANFGMPGDKPGFCAAHSSEGMVNRNKPRGGEGMLMTVARSSRRAAKTNSVSLTTTDAAAAAAPRAAPASSASNGSQPSSGGKGLLMRAGSARDGMGGGLDRGGDGYTKPRAFVGRTCSNGRHGQSYAEAPNNSTRKSAAISTGSSVANGSRRARVNDNGGRTLGPTRGSSSAFLLRGGHDSLISGSPPGRLLAVNGGFGSRERAGCHGRTFGASTIPTSVLQRPTAAPEGFMAITRGEAEAIHRRYADNGMQSSGSRSGGSGSGSGSGSSSIRAGRTIAATTVDYSFSGDFSGGVMDGSFLMDGASLDRGSVSTPTPLEMGGSLDEILGVEPDDLDARGMEANAFSARGTDGGAAHPDMRPLSGSLRNVHGLGFAGGVSTCALTENVIGASVSASVDFELDHLPELNSVDLTGLQGVPAGTDSSRDMRHAPSCIPAASPTSVGMNGSLSGQQMGGGTPSASCGVGGAPAPLSSSETVTSPVAAAAAAAVAAVRSNPSNHVADELVSTKTPSEEPWWEVLEGEDFVAMPEPMWGTASEMQSLTEDTARGQGEGRGWQAMKGGGVTTIANGGECAIGSTNGVGSGSADRMASRADDAKARALLSSSPGLGAVLGITDDGNFVGSSRRSDGRSDASVGYSPLANDQVRSRSVVDNGTRVSPTRKRQLSVAAGDVAPAYYSIGSANRSVKREMGSATKFSSPVATSSASCHTSTPLGFGLTVAPSSSVSPLTPATQLQSNTPSPGPLGIGGSSVRIAGVMQGPSMAKAWAEGDAWMASDAVSPSKRMALSPTKFTSASPSSSARPLLAQSTPPWGAVTLCSRQQTQAAGRA